MLKTDLVAKVVKENLVGRKKVKMKGLSNYLHSDLSHQE